MSKKEDSWFVYMLQCQDNTLYTGITIDLVQRLHKHNHTARGAKYTRSRRPVKIVYYEKYMSRSEAASREYALKQLSRKQKENLISTFSSSALK